VADALERRGANPIRLDTDLFPTGVRLSIRQGTRSAEPILHTAGGSIALTGLSSVWYRRYSPGHALPPETPMRAAAVMESRAALSGLIAVLQCFHLDPVEAVRRASNKSLQLKWAAELGLSVPRTLVTNDEEALRTFADECPNGFVAKALSSFVVRDDAGQDLAIYTTVVRPQDLDDLTGLNLSPLQFQERIPKAFDVRCTIVGKAVFAASLDSTLLPDGQVDWRICGSELAKFWHSHTLPAEVECRLLALLDRFGLNYGAVDLIVTPDGRHVFLEVNPTGEFLWLDDLSAGSISDAIAGVLVAAGRRL
jgi:glutathione synthase/RimK-type ligase-like ATP-grasp enzyme